MSGPSQSNSSTSTLDPQIKSLILGNANRAQGIADTPFQQYNGVLGAPLSQNQQLAQGAASTLNQAGAPALNLAQNAAGSLTNFNAPNGDFSGLISNYQNPYTDSVVNATMNDLDQQRQREIMGNGQNATLNNSFGGNRTGVADALTNDQYNRTAATTIANLRNTGFNNAASLAQQNQAMNQSGAISSAGVQNSAAGLLNNIGNSQQAGAQSYLTALSGTGGVDQATQNAQNSGAYQEFLRSIGYPAQGQTLLNQSLGLLPNSSTTTGTTSTNPGATGILGGVASLGNTAANLGWNPFGTTS